MSHLEKTVNCFFSAATSWNNIKKGKKNALKPVSRFVSRFQKFSAKQNHPLQEVSMQVKQTKIFADKVLEVADISFENWPVVDIKLTIRQKKKVMYNQVQTLR